MQFISEQHSMQGSTQASLHHTELRVAVHARVVFVNKFDTILGSGLHYLSHNTDLVENEFDILRRCPSSFSFHKIFRLATELKL
jgi:hypothetical protein